MTTAESIVRDYLDRGYSLDALRLLAESRADELGAEMLAVIGRMPASGEAPAADEDSGPCETAAYPVAADGEDMVFFVADDEEDVSREESVAEILIGETDGSGFIAPVKEGEAETGKKSGLISTEASREQIGILTRLWSRVAAKAGPAMEEHYKMHEKESEPAAAPAEERAESDVDPEVKEESTVADVLGTELTFEAVAEESSVAVETVSEESSVAVTEASTVSDAGGEQIVAEEIAESNGETESVFSESEVLGVLDQEMAEEKALADNNAETDNVPLAEPELPAVSPQVEMSSDYIPGSVADLLEDAAEEEGFAPASIEEARRALLDAQTALVDGGESGERAVQDNGDESKLSRKQRRKRERSRKKKEKKAAAQDELPEIVLTRSEGTETLMPETEECLSATEQKDAPLLPALAENGSIPEPEEPAAPRMSEPMSLLTPNDLLAEDSDAADIFKLDPEPVEQKAEAQAPEPAAAAPAEERQAADASVTEEEAAPEDADVPSLADARDPGDYLMIIANGGIPREDYADLLACEDNGPSGARTAAEEAGVAEEEDENVILFSEMFPVFAGVCGEPVDDDDEEPAAELPSNYLKMLSFEPADEEEVPAEDDEAIAFNGLRLLESSSGESEAEAVLETHEEYEPQAEMFLAPERLSLAEPENMIEEKASGLEPVLSGEPPAGEEEHGAAAVSENSVVALGVEERAVLLRALYGVTGGYDESVDDDATAPHHAIVAEVPDPAVTEAAEREAAIRREVEADCQERLDGISAQILQLQNSSVADTERLRQKQVELDAKKAIIDEMQKRLDNETKNCDDVACKLAEAKNRLEDKDKELGGKNEELKFFSGMRDEHQRLYQEFEDLRRGYNEVVSDVLPKLQSERDDLALTVERQCTNEEKMRASLGSVRKRMAVGYSLAGAACLALCALPVANWIKSGRVDREMAVEQQKLAELHETLQREVQNNIVARNTIVELENKVGMARAQLSDMHKKNQELAKATRQRQTQMQNQEVAVFKPPVPAAAGTPARASDMALQATAASGGRLHVNQVRDPSGSIEELAMQNRRAYQNQDGGSSQVAQGTTPPRPVALASVARAEPSGGGLRPTTKPNSLPIPPATQMADARKPKPVSGRNNGSIARPGEKTAKVKKGEGVAQVVYRVLGTWDPEVISWVVKENNLSLDKKGNPRIHPDQELRLPGDLRNVRSASR